MNEPPERASDADPTGDGAAARADAALEAAAGWLARLDSGTADPDAFEAWRARDPAHAIAFARAAAAWRALDAAPAGLPAATLRATPSRRAVLWSLAGLAVVAAGAGLSTRAVARETVVTGTGERRALRLAEGARADVNTGSRLEWRARGGRTEVWLIKGEAALHVAGDGDAVVLHAASAAFRLGPGRYNARLRAEDDLELIAVSGLVQSVAGARARAIRGQQLTVRAGAVSVAAAPAATLDKAEAWPRGEIVLENTSLEEAVGEYNRYLERKIVVADPAIAALRIGGRFTASDPSGFLTALEATLPVRARRTADVVVLTRAE